MLDGELVAFNDHGAPHWPLLYDRVLHGNTTIPVTYVVFDVMRVDGHDLTASPWSARRAVLEDVVVNSFDSRITDSGLGLGITGLRGRKGGNAGSRTLRFKRPGGRPSGEM